MSVSSATTVVGVPQSPDASPVVSLVLYDRDATDLYNRALTLATSLFPDWNPMMGNSEVLLLESLSTIAAETIFAINRLPTAITQSLLQLAGITPSPGAQAVGTVKITVGDLLGHVLPAGTAVQLVLSEGRAFTFTVNQTVTVGIGASVAAGVGVTCTEFSATPNLTASGTALSVQGGQVFVDSVVTDSMIVGGVDPETTQGWVERGTQLLQNLSSTLVTPFQFQQASLAYTGVWRCRVTNNWDPTAGGGNGASALGVLTVSVYGRNGASCTPQVMSGLATQLSNQAETNLAIYVKAPTITVVNVVANVQRLPNYADVDLVLSVQQAIGAYLSTDTWLWDGEVRYNKVMEIVENAAGVDFCTSLTLNGTVGDIVLGGIANLADATEGSILVNVTDPSSGAPTTRLTVTISATVFRTGSSDPVVQAAVAAAVTSWANTGIAAGFLRYTTLVVTIAQVANVQKVHDVRINGTTGDLTVVPSLTSLGAVTITMGN